MTRKPRPPRPEILFAVRSEHDRGVVVELQIARMVSDTELHALNMSRDSDSGRVVALNLATVNGVSVEAIGEEKVRVILGPEACDRLQIRDGDSLLLHQLHAERGRSPVGLATILSRGV